MEFFGIIAFLAILVVGAYLASMAADYSVFGRCVVKGKHRGVRWLVRVKTDDKALGTDFPYKLQIRKYGSYRLENIYAAPPSKERIHGEIDRMIEGKQATKKAIRELKRKHKGD